MPRFSCAGKFVTDGNTTGFRCTTELDAEIARNILNNYDDTCVRTSTFVDEQQVEIDQLKQKLSESEAHADLLAQYVSPEDWQETYVLSHPFEATPCQE